MASIPETLQIRGDLLLLRSPIETDYPHFPSILSDPLTMDQLRYMARLEEGGWTVSDVAARHARWGKLQKEQACLDLIAVEPRSNVIVGNCGLYRVDLKHRNAEFGLILHHPFWGKGYAAECHLLCLEYGFESLGLHRIQFSTSVTNLRMRKFFDSVGIAQEGITKESHFDEGRFKDSALYACFHPQWKDIRNSLKTKISRRKNIE